MIVAQLDERQDVGVPAGVQPEGLGPPAGDVALVHPVLSVHPRTQQRPGVVRADVQGGRDLGPGGAQRQRLVDAAGALRLDLLLQLLEYAEMSSKGAGTG
ncbi:hypothetical protein [Streptomyces sp. NPDC006739]|uniref:hypothetical protein n=1 Tax=Streptomyces sp. NPDC006739 TaxID=3364763 RepID=UPI0036C34EC9